MLIGAGLRGRYVYGGYSRAHPERLRIAAVAELDPGRRAALAEAHDLPPERVFADWRELLRRPRLAEAAVIATDDPNHTGPALEALARGYHVLLEKPIATTLEECERIVEAAEKAERILQIAHVLRYTAFYQRVAELLASGRLGRILTVEMKENVAHWHMTHSYVRGKFRSREVAAPIILAKCCHDLDLLVWLVARPARRLVSFGELSLFRPERAPAGAPERCTDGCPAAETCPHDAVRFYLGPDDSLARAWPWLDVSADPTREARRRALETGRYGRCAFRCDNDVPDHQMVLIDFEDGVQASLTLNGHATSETRTLRISGSEGELRGVLRDGLLELTRHGSFETERIQLPESEAGHFGGDARLLDHFTDVASRDAVDEVRTSGRASLESHVLGFAAERSRLEGRVIELGG